jgi:hypothetical protein
MTHRIDPNLKSDSYVDAYFEITKKKPTNKYSKYGEEFKVLDILPDVSIKEKREEL